MFSAGKYYLCLFFCLCSLFSFAQQNKVDELEKEIAAAKTDTAKFRLLLYITNFYEAKDSLKAFQLCWEAMGIAQAMDDDDMEGRALNQIGKKYFDYSNSDKALTYYEKAVEKFTSAGDKIFTAKVYTNMGHAYHMKSKYDKALELYFAAMKIYETEGDKRGVAKIYISLSNVYNRMGQFEKQKEVLEKGLALTEETGDLNAKNACLINLGNYYAKTKKYKEALNYYREGAKLSEQLNNLQFYSNALGNIGAVYGEMGMDDSALYYMKKNVSIVRKTGDYYGMVTGYTNLVPTLLDMKKYDEALQYADSAEKMSLKLNYPLGLKISYEAFADVYHETGNDSAAYRYMQLFIAANDSVMSSEMNEQINNMTLQFEQEKKNSEIEVLKEKNKAQNLTIIFVAVAGFLILLLAVLLFKRNQVKQKANVQLGKQNQEIQMQKEIIEEKNRSITDSIRYAKRIQESLLPTEKYIERNLKRLKK